MRFLTVVVLVVVLVLDVPMRAQQTSQPAQPVSTADELRRLSHSADEAHARSDVRAEIEYRRRYSHIAWAAGDPRPSKRSVYWWGLIYENDLPLAILLEGTQQWPEAEALYRHNQQEFAHDPVAGDDIKANNELHLAHLLEGEGKQEEARSICRRWEGPVKHLADWAVSAVKYYGVPRPPLYDSPEVEVGAWDLACGRPEQGMGLLREQMAAHPQMLTPYTFLSQYYFAEGDFKDGLKTETDGVSALLNGTAMMDIEVVTSESELR